MVWPLFAFAENKFNGRVMDFFLLVPYTLDSPPPTDFLLLVPYTLDSLPPADFFLLVPYTLDSLPIIHAVSDSQRCKSNNRFKKLFESVWKTYEYVNGSHIMFFINFLISNLIRSQFDSLVFMLKRYSHIDSNE